MPIMIIISRYLLNISFPKKPEIFYISTNNFSKRAIACFFFKIVQNLKKTVQKTNGNAKAVVLFVKNEDAR